MRVLEQGGELTVGGTGEVHTLLGHDRDKQLVKVGIGKIGEVIHAIGSHKHPKLVGIVHVGLRELAHEGKCANGVLVKVAKARACGPQVIGHILDEAKVNAGVPLVGGDLLDGGPCGSLVGSAVNPQLVLERIDVLRHDAALQLDRIAANRRHDGEREEQQRVGDEDAHEQYDEARGVAQEDAQAKALHVAHALGQRRLLLRTPATSHLAAQKLQRRKAQLKQKANEKDCEQQHKRHEDRLEVDVRMEAAHVGRQAVRIVIRLSDSVLHRDGISKAQQAAHHTHDHRQREVVPDQLALCVAHREQRADGTALLLDGGIGEQHKDEGENDREDDREGQGRAKVALVVARGIADTLVVLIVDHVAHRDAMVDEHLDHALLTADAIGQGQVAVTKEERVCEGLVTLGQRVTCPRPDLTHAKREGVVHDVSIVLEERDVVGEGHDAADCERLVVELHGIAQGQLVVLHEHTVERHFVVCLGRAALGIAHLIEALAVTIEANRRVVDGATGDGEAGIIAKVLVHRTAQRLYILDGICLSLEVGHEATVLDVVLLAHAAHHVDVVLRRLHVAVAETYGHHQQNQQPNIAPEVMFDRARVTLAKRRHLHAPLPSQLGRGRRGGIGLILDKEAVAQAQDVVAHPADGIVVRNDDHRGAKVLVNALHELQDLLGRLVVERTCGLVAQQQAGRLHEGATDGAALLLATRNLIGKLVAMLPEAKRVQQIIHGQRLLGEVLANLDVLAYRKVGHEVVELEDEAKLASAVLHKLLAGNLGDVGITHDDAAGVCGLKATHNVQER